MTTIASGIILGFLLATAYAAGFHLIIGGRPSKIILYLAAAWLGFLIGHFIGELVGVNALSLGAVNLISASIGSWLALISSWFLSNREA